MQINPNPAGPDASGALDTLLASYAAGGLNPHLHALVASHLALSPKSRAFVAALEAVRGRDLEDMEPVDMQGRDARLAAIFAAGGPDLAPDAASEPADAVFPAPLRRLIGCDARDIAWRWVLPGIRECKVGASEGGDAKLYRIAPGRRLPSHTHLGSEATLVLAGSFRDAAGTYRRGDIAIADSEIDHIPVAGLDGDCICFAVTDAPLELTGPVARVIGRLFGTRH